MERSLNSSNVVINANVFNPSVFRESFLADRGVLSPEGKLEPGFIFSDQVVSVPTKDFTLLVVAQQLQLVLVQSVRANSHEIVRSVIPPIVEELPHTPYTAAGINFVWFVVPEETLAVVTRRLFPNARSIFGDVFDVPDACFGYFASKDLDGVRLRADVKPVIVEEDKQRREVIQCVLNFHMDLAGQDAAPQKISELCGRWREFDELSEMLVGRIAGGAT